jgi:hypothetical protein
MPLPSGWGYAFGSAINGSGQVTGYGGAFGANSQAFIGTTSGSSAIPLPSGWNYAYGYAINDSGQVAGYGGQTYAAQAFIGTIAGSTPIPLLPGWTWSYGYAVNDSGQVAGCGGRSRSRPSVYWHNLGQHRDPVARRLDLCVWLRNKRLRPSGGI